MTWIRLDDNFPDHPKVLPLTAEAFRLYVTGLCYAGRYLTDGFLPASIVIRMGADEQFAHELVDAGLWYSDDDGYVIHDYAQYQPTREKVTAAREKSKQRIQSFREKRKSNAVTSHDVSPDVTPVVTYDVTVAPSHPIPSHKKEQELAVHTAQLPRTASAKDAVTRISNKLGQARAAGINAWNLSRLVEDEWDELHKNNDIGGCIALTVWYVSELQSRNLEGSEIARIGQMTKRFGRIALLAIDDAASKDLTDLVSYAFRIAQAKHKEMSA